MCFVSDTQARWSTVQLHRVEAGFEVLGAYFAGYRLEFSILRPYRCLALDSNCGKWIGRGDIETFVDCCIANSAKGCSVVISSLTLAVDIARTLRIRGGSGFLSDGA